jgi:hypothetical protein
MPPKDLLIQELDTVSEPLIVELLDFLRFLKTKQTQDGSTLAEAGTRQVAEASNHPLQGKEPYRYDDPFTPAVLPEAWDVLQ